MNIKRSFLLVVMLLMAAFGAKAQIMLKYSQGFEDSGETYGYTVTSGDVATQSTIVSGGSKALKMSHTTTAAQFVTDVIDFTDNGAYQYFILEFNHATDVDPLVNQSADYVCVIEAKRPDQANWITLGASNYDRSTGGGSEDFIATTSFSNRSYGEWEGSAINNTWWKHERFSLSTPFFTGVAVANRKLQIRFTLQPRRSGTSNQGWYIDGITVKSSISSMTPPVLTMTAWPDMEAYPSSRGARINFDARTASSDGLAADSCYVLYKVGSDPTIRRVQMNVTTTQQGNNITYHGKSLIPFHGYDTLIYYRVVVKDASTNHNTTTFPADQEGWERYRCVRGSGRVGLVGNLNEIAEMPFPSSGDSRTQAIYDSATLAESGLKVGAITRLSLVSYSNASNSTRENFTIKMCNLNKGAVTVANNANSPSFYAGLTKTVYDSSLTLNVGSGTRIDIDLQDTFYYAGKDILMIVTYDNNSTDPAEVKVRGTSCAPNQNSIYQNMPAFMGFNPYQNTFFNSGYVLNKRPSYTFYSVANAPLIYDCGVEAIISPSDTMPAYAGASNNNSVVLKLTNYGVQSIRGVRLWYQVDDLAPQYYDWSGNLGGGTSVNVTVSVNQHYTVGYHNMTAWVDDTLTVQGNNRVRDHEPYNDTAYTPFVGCSGPMHGVIQVGGTNPDYETIDQFLYALSQCGVNGAVTVKLAPGTYPSITIPLVNGISARNYIQFEPLDGSDTSVVFTPTNTQQIVDLRNEGHVRFKKITFRSHYQTSAVTYHIRMSNASRACQFLNCHFEENLGTGNISSRSVVSSIIYSGGADSTLVQGCTFTHGRIAVNYTGPSADNHASYNRAIANTFTDQRDNAIIVRNQWDAVVDSNYMNNVLTNTSYVLLVQDCSGQLKVTRNKIYSEKGAGCIGVSTITASGSLPAIFANNMVVCNDDGTANTMNTPFNIISATNTKFVFNSIKMTAQTRTSMAATSLGGGYMNGCRFQNNIVACFDTMNAAFSYATFGGASIVSNNVYYSTGMSLCKYNSADALTIEQWATYSGDTTSANINPAFANSGRVDLRTYNVVLKQVGVSGTGITVDMFGTNRNAQHPCPGAFECPSLNHEFEIVSIVNPIGSYCEIPTAAPLIVTLRNNGSQTFQPSSSSQLRLYYSRSSQRGVMAPGQSGSILVNRSIPANDTIVFNTGRNLSFPALSDADTTYQFQSWLSSTLDPNTINDSASFEVTALAHAPAITTTTFTSNYAEPAEITLTNGVQTWNTDIYTSGRQTPSTCYWYTSPTETVPFYRGNSYTTNVLYTDTTFYIRQKRELPMVRFTEIQISNTGTGVTAPMPAWMNTTTKFAIELTNVGDYPAQMEGDTVMVVSSNNSFNNKKYVFPNFTIEPGQSIVLQFFNTPNVDSNFTLSSGLTLNPAYNVPLSIIYYDGHGAADAVVFNNLASTFYSTIPPQVWSGSGITITNGVAGVIRKSWPTNPNAAPANSAQYWSLSSATDKMTLGVPPQELIQYFDNGCIGAPAPINIHLVGYPTVDIAIDSLTLPSGCGISTTPITATYHNYGFESSPAFTSHFSVNGVAVGTDNVPAMPAGGSVTRTFSTPANLTSLSGEQTFEVKVWAEHNSDDNTPANDTMTGVTTTLYTPLAPVVSSPVDVRYGNRGVLTVAGSQDVLIWSDKNHVPLDTTRVFETDYLFYPDTFFVSAVATASDFVHIGNLANVNAANAYPSPYNPNVKYGREQYIFTASELAAAGYRAGTIKAISFYLENILVSGGSVTFDNFKIRMGTTSQNNFTGNSDWLPTTEVYSAGTLTLTNGANGQRWVTHNFTTPFVWDGTSNIVVCVIRSQEAAQSAGAQTRYTAAAANQCLYLKGSAATIIGDTPGAGARNANRPDIRFGFSTFSCQGPESMVAVNITGTPTVDASLEFPLEMDTMAFASCGNTDFNVVVRNNGLNAISGYTIDYWVDGVPGTFTTGPSVEPRQAVQLTIATPLLHPGRHSLRAIVNMTGDTLSINDTIGRMINVRFCAGTYEMGASSTSIYANFQEVFDTLRLAGVDGPITIAVDPGVYQEQLNEQGEIPGSSATNTVTFQSITGNADDVVLKAAPTQNDNYVLHLNNTGNITFGKMTIYAVGTGNFSHAVQLTNVSNIGFNGTKIRVKGTLNNVNGSCLIINEGVRNLRLDSCVLDSGYYSIKSMVANAGASSGITLCDNAFRNFWSQGINLRKVNNVAIRRNTIRSGVGIASRPLTGVVVGEHTGGVIVEGNNIVMFDEKNGGKRGIVLGNCRATNASRNKVYNNFVDAHSTGTAGQIPAGIVLDSCNYTNVYYNTVRVYAGVNAATSNAFQVAGTSSFIYVINNIFSNFSRGYAYNLANVANVTNSNYNVYYSDTTHTRQYATHRLAKIGTAELINIDTLRSVTTMDGNSMFDRPYYIADDDLHLAFGLYAELAQYNSEVPSDIDGELRSQIPPPTIGADEYTRCVHNTAIMELIEPSTAVEHIETDTMRVIVKLFNDGSSAESNLRWFAEVLGTSAVSPRRAISQILPGEVIFDTTYVPMPIGVFDTQTVQVQFFLANDCNAENNTVSTRIFFEPAFNIKATSIQASTGSGCELRHVPITIALSNVGKKAIPTNYPIEISYQAIVNTAGVTVPQFPITNTETVRLTQPLPVNGVTSFNFYQTANFYPEGNSKDIVIRLRGWHHYIYDGKPLGTGADTTNYINVTSKYTPVAPTSSDVHLPYGSWDTLFASHMETLPGTPAPRPIRWYRDSTQAPFFANSNYSRSTWWETPQYFHDSTYYVNCISSTNCPSHFTPIHVYVNAPVSTDAAVLSVEEPLSKVYMTNDTVKVTLVNYGSQALTNVPVVYQLRRNSDNRVLMQVREVCTVSIAPGATQSFVFDSLLNIPAVNTIYNIRVWTDMPGEQVRSNDTIRYPHVFTALPERTYVTPYMDGPDGLDIIRLTYNALHVEMPALGRTYTAAAQIDDPYLIPLHVTRGTTDSLIIQVASNEDLNDRTVKGTVAVFVDYNRDGFFSNSHDAKTELVFVDSIQAYQKYSYIYTVPSKAMLGYMRCRVIVTQDSVNYYSVSATNAISKGHVLDFLLYVEDTPLGTDVALPRIIAPTEQIVSVNDSLSLTFAMSNKGATDVTTCDITCRIENPDSVYTYTFTWTGNLASGASTAVTLPDRFWVPEGTTNITLTVAAPGDINMSNNTLKYQYHRFHKITLIYQDDFEGEDIWYAPMGSSNFNYNVWERGRPTKRNLNRFHSDSLVWATKISDAVTAGAYGNLSYLYTPIINIAQIRPDTISFWLARAIGSNCQVWLEYYNYLGEWIPMDTTSRARWYTDPAGFIGNSASYRYEQYFYPTSLISGEFQQNVQFRWVFRAAPGASDCDGVAIDDFRIGRARRAVDAGVVDIIYPVAPQFGQTIRPRIVIKNYGYDTLRSVNVAYGAYGVNLPRTGTYQGMIPPDGTDTYQFPDAFTIRSDFPDTFNICAYTTVNLDIYWENDSTCKPFALSPLDHDMDMIGIVYPHEMIVAGDSVAVTVRIRNFGLQPVAETDIVYTFNNSYTVRETVNFADRIGHDLQPYEYLNYTFDHKFRASMGYMDLSAYVSMPNDDYLYNDSTSMHLVGISSVADIRATEIVVDTTSFTTTKIQLTIDNIGARAANNFEVCYYIDNDPTTLVRDTFNMGEPLAALNRAYFVFNETLPNRPYPNSYRYVTAYVNLADDNERANDTTSLIAVQYPDLEAVRVLVEENRYDSCHVRFEIVNRGNFAYTRPFTVSATVNGETLTTTSNRRIDPGEVYSIDMDGKVRKNLQRQYVGSGFITAPGDHDSTNNQTTVVFVQNYFDGIPTVNAVSGGIVLEQNQPNPFTKQTRIDFFLPQQGTVRFFVMDAMGRLVYQKSVDCDYGNNTINFSQEELSTGIYYYGIQMDDRVVMRKMIRK